MTRRKVKLAYIAKNSARKATFNKRKNGLLHKADELSTLCGVDTCAIIYSPYTAAPITYPNNPAAVHGVLERFGAMSLDARANKMVDQRQFLRQSIVKADQLLHKLRAENREKETVALMLRALASPDRADVLKGVGLGKLNELRSLVEGNLSYMNDIIKYGGEILVKNVESTAIDII